MARRVMTPAVARIAALLAVSLFALSGPLLAERSAAAAPASYAERQAAWERHRELSETSLFRGLEWRPIGPVVQGGRVVDIESVPGEPYTFYVAYASGGLWRTTNNGVTFEPLFDDQATLIMGDLAIDPSHPSTLWVGSGENNSSRSSYGGIGVFRSDDAGATWRHMGLGDSDRVGRILVDPRSSERVYVATLGKLYTPGGERGIYRTQDGGKTWEQILAGDEVTGFADLVMDPSNPDVLYAAAWERSRKPWDFVEGGPGSAVWKSTDGGDRWTRLEGLPSGESIGRIGLAVAPSQPRTIYAVIDNQEPLPEELWDLGDSAVTAKRLRKMSKEDFLAQDPAEIERFIRSSDLDTELDAKRLVAMVENDELTLEALLGELDEANQNLFQTDIRGLEVWRSDDAGETWSRTHDEPLRQVVYTYGYYFGQIRVAPKDPERVYVVGVPLVTSADGGKTWSGINGRDVHVDHHDVWVDPNFPDRLISGNDGGLDVSYDGGRSWLKLDAQSVGQFYTVEVDMAEPYNVYGGLQDNGVLKGASNSRPRRDPWQRIGGGDGMYIQVDPRDNQTTYLGLQFGFYSRIDPDGKRATVRPRDALGEPALRYNWATPVLMSRHNHDVIYFGANRLYRSLDKGETWQAISPDLTHSQERGDVPFATLSSIDESSLAFGLLWAGSDDGQLHVSDDGGGEWRDASAGLPADRWVSRVEASHHEREVAYVGLNGYRNDDTRAYLYRTEDLGRTWTSLAAGLPAEPINVVREDPENADVLYVGTDRGVYVSLDRGATWQGLPSGLPKVPVHDLIVHPRERELVAATHGRSMWILDALPIQELTAERRQEAVHVFPVEGLTAAREWRSRRSPWFYDPEDDPEVNVPFWARAAGETELQVLDGDGRVLRRLEMAAEAGVNTFTWDLLLDEALALPAEQQRLAAASTGDEKSEKGRRGKKGKGKKPSTEEKSAVDDNKGKLAKTPWAEAHRLGWPPYVTPGTYTLRVIAAGGQAETEIEIERPKPPPPRAKKKPPIRGRKDDL